jgi:hypothetical protein
MLSLVTKKAYGVNIRLVATISLIAVLCGVLLWEPWSSSGVYKSSQYQNTSNSLATGLKLWDCGCTVSSPHAGSFWVAESFITNTSDHMVTIRSASVLTSGDPKFQQIYLLDDGFATRGVRNGASLVTKFPYQWNGYPLQELRGAVLHPSHSYTLIIHEFLGRREPFAQVHGLQVGVGIGSVNRLLSTGLSFLQCNAASTSRIGFCSTSIARIQAGSKSHWYSLTSRTIEPVV